MVAKEKRAKQHKHVPVTKDRPFHMLIANTMKKRKLTIAQFAKLCSEEFNVSFESVRALMYRYLYEDVFPRKTFIKRAAHALSLSEAVLTDAHNEERRCRKAAKPVKTTTKAGALSFQEQALITNFRKTVPAFRSALVKVVKEAARQTK